LADRVLRVATVGQGFMGRAHSNAFRQAGHFYDLPVRLDLRLLCGRDQARLDEMAARYGWAATATDWRAAVERPDIDVVDIAVPNNMHAEVAIAAARAGKIVWCEKPLAVNAEESARMVEAARGVPTMVWFNYRRLPAVVLTRRLIDEGRIGQVFHYRALYLQEWGADPTRPPNWKTDRAVAGSGVLGDLLSHSIDLALMLNGAIRDVAALQHTFAGGRAVDDATLVLARFANGSLGSFEATRYATGCKNHNSFQIHGSRGAVRFNLEDLNRLDFADAAESRDLQGFRSILVNAPQFWKPGHVIGYEHTFIAAVADFLSAWSRGGEFHPDFRDAHEVQRVLAAVERSAASGSATTAV